jgi:hypothetical protein
VALRKSVEALMALIPLFVRPRSEEVEADKYHIKRVVIVEPPSTESKPDADEVPWYLVRADEKGRRIK